MSWRRTACRKSKRNRDIYERITAILQTVFTTHTFTTSFQYRTCFNADIFTRSTAIRQQTNCTNAPVAQAAPNAIESAIRAKRFSSAVGFNLKQFDHAQRTIQWQFAFSSSTRNHGFLTVVFTILNIRMHKPPHNDTDVQLIADNKHTVANKEDNLQYSATAKPFQQPEACRCLIVRIHQRSIDQHHCEFAVRDHVPWNAQRGNRCEQQPDCGHN